MTTQTAYPPSSTTNISVISGVLSEFTADDVVSDVVTLEHSMDAKGACITVIDGNGRVILPDEITFYSDGTTPKIDLLLSSYIVSGTWYVKIN